MDYQPYLFIGIGEYSHFFTLRETYLHKRWVGDKCYAEVRSHHHFNLSQNPQEAFEKAQAAAERFGLELRCDGPEQLGEQLREIKRATAEELEKRQREAAEREARWAEERAEREAFRFELLKHGIWPLPKGGVTDDMFDFVITKHKDVYGKTIICTRAFAAKLDKGELECGRDAMPLRQHSLELIHYSLELIREKDVSLLTWWAYHDEFETDIAKELQKWILEHCQDLLLPRPDPHKLVGEVGKREEFLVTVTKTFVLDGFYGPVHFVTMVTPDGACLLSKGAFRADVGAKLKIKATVKEHGEYKGQAQTVIQRVKVEAQS